MVTRNMERAKVIAASMHAEGREVKYVFQDATKPESDLSLVEEVVAHSGHIMCCLTTSELPTRSRMRHCEYNSRCIF